MILPTQHSPANDVEIDDMFLLRPHKRVGIQERSQTSYYNSIQIINRSSSKPHTYDDYKKLILFHSFIFDENVGIEYFEEISSIELLYPDAVLAEPTNYENILDCIYLIDPRSIPKGIAASYVDLYMRYKQLNEKELSLIKNYVTDFFHNPSAPNRQIVNTGYWQIMVYYSIIENILTKQPFCAEKHVCSVCGRKNINHNIFSEKEWITKKINEIVKSPSRASEYIKLMSSVRKAIRHNTVHKSIYPTAEYKHFEKDRVVYDIVKSFEEFTTDQTALTSIVYSLRNLAKYFLLNKLFNLNVFPSIPPLVVVSISPSSI